MCGSVVVCGWMGGFDCCCGVVFVQATGGDNEGMPGLEEADGTRDDTGA